MNLETFKARARRKLALPARTRPTSIAPQLVESEIKKTATPPANPTLDAAPEVALSPGLMTPNLSLSESTLPNSQMPDTPKPDTSIDASPNSVANHAQNLPQSQSVDEDRFAAAMRHAARTNADTNRSTEPEQQSTTGDRERRSGEDNETAIRRWPGSERQADSSNPIPLTTEAQSNQSESSDTQLARLRSLLLGPEYPSRHDNAEAVYQRTQADLNTLRHEMDARLTALSDQVKKLEDSLSTRLETQGSGLSDQNAQLLMDNDERLDALDTRVTELLETARSELGERRAANRDHLETKLAAITDHGEQQLQAVSQRLEASIAGMQSRISAQLSHQSSTIAPRSEADISALREQLEAVIDERVRSVNEEQSTGIRKLRDVMLAHTDSIKTELQAQTEAQKTLLATHRHEIESQFNGALTTLNDNKVSHQDLGRLLDRLADRIQRL